MDTFDLRCHSWAIPACSIKLWSWMDALNWHVPRQKPSSFAQMWLRNQDFPIAVLPKSEHLHRSAMTQKTR